MELQIEKGRPYFLNHQPYEFSRRHSSTKILLTILVFSRSEKDLTYVINFFVKFRDSGLNNIPPNVGSEDQIINFPGYTMGVQFIEYAFEYSLRY